MKILIICQWFPPEYAPIGVMLSELAQDLSLKGHAVTIITGFPNHPSGIVFNGYKKRLFTEERVGMVRVVRCFLYTSPKKTFVSRLLNYISFAITSFWAAVRLDRHDLLFMVSPPLSNGLIALFLAKFKKLRFVFNVQDIYPDAAISTGVIRNTHLIGWLNLLERAIYQKASKVSVISDGFRSNLLAKGVPETKIQVIHNWLDTGEIVPVARNNEFAAIHDLAGRFVVLYSGTIGMISGAEILVECAVRLKSYKDILFLFIGDGVVKEAIADKAKASGLENIRFLPFQPREILSQVQSTADVSVVTLLKGKGKTSVPSKVLGYMAAARPVIASVDFDSDTRRLIESAGCGICVDAEDVAGLSAAIESLYHDRALGAVLGRSGRDYLVSHCDRKVVTSLYERLFYDCCKE